MLAECFVGFVEGELGWFLWLICFGATLLVTYGLWLWAAFGFFCGMCVCHACVYMAHVFHLMGLGVCLCV